MVILGSREQLCIHDEVSLLRGKAQTNACHYVCRKRKSGRCAQFTLAAGNSPPLVCGSCNTFKNMKLYVLFCGTCYCPILSISVYFFLC